MCLRANYESHLCPKKGGVVGWCTTCHVDICRPVGGTQEMPGPDKSGPGSGRPIVMVAPNICDKTEYKTIKITMRYEMAGRVA